MDIYARLKKEIRTLADKYSLNGDAVRVAARTLSGHEVIGDPEEKDFPLVKGRERMMEAVFRGARGQAFTDMYGDWQGGIDSLLDMDLPNNFRRAIFVASLNAIMNALGLIDKTVHCKDGDPKKCGQQCLTKLLSDFNPSTVTMVGYQPRMFECLRRKLMVHVVDMDPDNVGRVILGTKIVGVKQTEKCVEKADVLLVTGTTLVNNTIGAFLRAGRPTLFYGVTIAGAAKLLGLDRYCPFGI